MTTSPPVQRGPARGSSGRRLRTGARHAVLVVHIASTGAWLGIDVAMAVVIFTAMATADPATRAFSLRALEVITVWPLLTAGLICLTSGVVLGLGSRWGLVRYWWVAIKLGLNLVLTALVPLALRPEVTRLAEQARRWATGEPVAFDMTNLVYPPIVSPIALLVAMTLAVTKPWGRIRARARRPDGTGSPG